MNRKSEQRLFATVHTYIHPASVVLYCTLIHQDHKSAIVQRRVTSGSHQDKYQARSNAHIEATESVESPPLERDLFFLCHELSADGETTTLQKRTNKNAAC